MPEFFHGVRTRQLPTSLIPPIQANAALNMVWGTAPIHRLPKDERELAMPGNISLLFSLREAGEQMGIDVQNDDLNKWTLSQAAYVNLLLFGAPPVLFVNVFNPDVHFGEVTEEEVALLNHKGQLENVDVFDGITLSPSGGGGTAFIKGVDYDINLITGVITAIESGAMWSATSVVAAYKYAAPEMVDASDVIGGYDVLTGVTTGLELVSQAMPRFRVIPGILTAPKFSEDPTVAMLMAMKCRDINGVFNAVAYADLPIDGTTGIKKYTEAPAYKNNNNLVSEDLYLC